MNGEFPRNGKRHIPSVQLSRRDFYRMLSRHRRKALFAFLVVVSGATAITLLSPKIYQSQSMLYVRLGRENVRLDPTATLGQTPVMTIPESRESEINSVVEILKSRAMAEKVVDAIGPEVILGLETNPAGNVNHEQVTSNAEDHIAYGLSSKIWNNTLVQLGLITPVSRREQAIVKLRRNFSADAFKKADLLSLSFRADSAALAQKIVAKFAELYLDEHVTLNRTPNAHQFLERQTDRLRVQLTQSEKELKKLKQETELVSSDSQSALLIGRINRLQDELLATETVAAATKTEVEDLGKKLSDLSAKQVSAVTTGLNNTAADGMRQLLYGLQLQEKKLAAEYTEEHVALKSIREQIIHAEAILNQEPDSRSTVTEGPSRAYEEINLARLRQEALLHSMESKANTLSDQLVSTRGQLQIQIENELRIATLQRDVQLQDASYRKYVDNLEQAHIDRALETERISNINVVQSASYSEKPVGPNILFNLAAGVVGGVFAGLGLALLAESLDHSLKTPEEIESKLNLPLLASIPRLNRQELAHYGGKSL
jgi:uncharacterized protein involved in exopolysaccharide biosynthesis